MGQARNEPDVRTWIADLRRGAAGHREKKPATKVGQVRAAWEDIERAISNGQRPTEIQIWLAGLGLDVDVATLRCYIRRIRKKEAEREQRLREQQGFSALAGTVAAERIVSREYGGRTGEPPSWANSEPRKEEPFNPLEQAQRALSRKRFDIREIHGDGDPKNKNLI